MILLLMYREIIYTRTSFVREFEIDDINLDDIETPKARWVWHFNDYKIDDNILYTGVENTKSLVDDRDSISSSKIYQDEGKVIIQFLVPDTFFK